MAAIGCMAADWHHQSDIDKIERYKNVGLDSSVGKEPGITGSSHTLVILILFSTQNY